MRGNNHRSVLLPDSRGPGIHANASMNMQNLSANHPTLTSMIPQQTAGPSEAPMPQHAPNAEVLLTTLRRTEAAMQLAAQISSPNGLGDPAQRPTLSSAAHEINRARAAAAVFAAVTPLKDSWTCVVCLEEYQITDSVSVSSCHHHFHTNCITVGVHSDLATTFPLSIAPCAEMNV